MLCELETSSRDSRDLLQAQLRQRDDTIHSLQQDFASLQRKHDCYNSEVMVMSVACKSAVFYSSVGVCLVSAN